MNEVADMVALAKRFLVSLLGLAWLIGHGLAMLPAPVSTTHCAPAIEHCMPEPGHDGHKALMVSGCAVNCPSLPLVSAVFSPADPPTPIVFTPGHDTRLQAVSPPTDTPPPKSLDFV